MTALVIAHGHPRFNTGGAEIAAYRLYKALRESEGWEQSCFLAACPDNAMLKPGCEVFGLSDSEWLIRRSSDALLHDTNINLTTTEHGFLYSVLKSLSPSVIHFHHYVHIGLDLLHALKRWFPNAKVVLTLHEYWGLCPYEGRLLRRNGSFCDGPEPDACAACVGEGNRLPLAIRRLRIDHYFSVIDQLISPSSFLKDRYVQWGVEAKRISVIENLPLPVIKDALLDPSENLAANKKQSESGLVLGYFGQVNRWKGIDILLEAFSVVSKKCPDLRLELHGFSENLLLRGQEFHDPDFLSSCRRLIMKTPSGSVQMMGSYESEELPSRLRDVDVVVMASRWYENAPMVIQESFAQGVPVVAPHYGGMAEKIEHMVTGLLCTPFGVDTLANSLLWMAHHPELRLEMSRRAREQSLSYDSVFQAHMAIYDA